MRFNQNTTTPYTLIMVLSSALLACADGNTSRDFSASGQAVEIGFTKKTTDGNIARENLRANTESLQRQLRNQPNNLGLRAQLINNLLMQTQFLGSYGDFDRALALAEESSLTHSEAPLAKISLARVLGALHRFDEAIDLLETLPKSDDVEVRIASMKAAQGHQLIEDHALKQSAAGQSADFNRLTAFAAAEANLGNYQQADEIYLKALSQYNDVSPFPVAWVMFQRGVMWAEKANQPHKALPLYRAAVSRLPGYVVATVHLAELEAENGYLEHAINLLSEVAGQTEDPEPSGFLGELLFEISPDKAKDLVTEANEKYDDLLSKHRAAFADHGAEFFAGPGNDAQRGLELALFNLEHRQTDRAYQVAIEAAQAADQLDLACELSAERPIERVNPALQALISDLQAICTR